MESGFLGVLVVPVPELDREPGAVEHVQARLSWSRLTPASRASTFGRETISFLVILPIALPGIVTGMALNATFREVLEPFGLGLGLFTVIVGHATFCIVVVFNNVAARMRRTSRSFEEASADLGASTWQTFAT